WVLEGDIKGCYDNISHEWMLANIPMDRVMLRKWLEAGYMEENRLYPSHKGTPQGGIASPALANMTLDGIERVAHETVPRQSRVNFIRYADDGAPRRRTWVHERTWCSHAAQKMRAGPSEPSCR
ncbi:MAG: hypothetical protein HY881_09445, partial [Deltaproteobacteria bacterium]|nr:hypothetical protein [Deltaproteobacteria bacterium]